MLAGTFTKVKIIKKLTRLFFKHQITEVRDEIIIIRQCGTDLGESNCVTESEGDVSSLIFFEKHVKNCNFSFRQQLVLASRIIATWKTTVLAMNKNYLFSDGMSISPFSLPSTFSQSALHHP